MKRSFILSTVICVLLATEVFADNFPTSEGSRADKICKTIVATLGVVVISGLIINGIRWRVNEDARDHQSLNQSLTVGRTESLRDPKLRRSVENFISILRQIERRNHNMVSFTFEESKRLDLEFSLAVLDFKENVRRTRRALNENERQIIRDAYHFSTYETYSRGLAEVLVLVDERDY